MENTHSVLSRRLSEQIALEEHLCRTIEDQVTEIQDSGYAETRELLKQISGVIAGHFSTLNEVCDRIEQNVQSSRAAAIARNGVEFQSLLEREQRKRLLSQILRDNYSALNLVCVSNTLLHTIALVLGSQEVAALALEHIENLAPLVRRMEDLIPQVAARELRMEGAKFDASLGLTALKNTQRARSAMSDRAANALRLV